MFIDREFIRAARAAFNPFVTGSGTELVAELLHSIVRMVKPRSVIEFGSGYTTLFLLAALHENVEDFAEESRCLRAKTLAATAPGSSTDSWYQAEGRACQVDPGFYVGPYLPKLYCFDDGNDSYTNRLMDAVRSFGLSELFVYNPGKVFSVDALPPEAFPIDIAWNDDSHYGKFFNMFWPRLNPKGGLMAFHNTVAVQELWDAIEYLKERRGVPSDLEIITFPEPHKIWQNSCTILRRTTNYEPTHKGVSKDRIMSDLMKFMEQRKGQ